MIGMSVCGRWFLAACLCLAYLTGCGGTDDRLVNLDARIKALDGQMRLGEVREVALPMLREGEWIVAVAGQYGGRACQPSALSSEASQEVSDFGGSESFPAFLLLISGDHVVSDMALSVADSPLAIQPSEKDQALCALIAGSQHRALVVECMKPSSDKPSGRTCEVVLRAVK